MKGADLKRLPVMWPWSRTAPTKPGYYWARSRAGRHTGIDPKLEGVPYAAGEPMLVEVIWNSDGAPHHLVVWMHGNECEETIDHFSKTHEWIEKRVAKIPRKPKANK